VSLKIYCPDIIIIIIIIIINVLLLSVTVAARFKALTVLERLNTGTVGSKPFRGLGVCLLYFIGTVLLRG
jgi:hypothetical protein